MLGPAELARQLRNPSANLKEKYRNDPLALAERLGLKLPKKPVLVMIELGVITEEEAIKRFGAIEPGLRELIEDICLEQVESAVGIANRGGGKSFGVSFCEFFLWLVLDYDCVNLGGSEQQAKGVYNHVLGFVESDPGWIEMIRGGIAGMKLEETKAKTKRWIKVLTASQKSTRSPHAGGEDHGGLLVVDEEAEADPEIVSSAMATVNTGNPSVRLRISTFHNLEGSFREVVDHAEEMGYKIYKWDIFDSCSGCPCGPDECESPEPCFREDHYETYVDPETQEPRQRLLHRAYCGGRARYARGHIPMKAIISQWKSYKRDHAVWEVEAMGSRPSTHGHVIKDLTKFATCVTMQTGAQLYAPGSPVYVCVDWGTNAAAVTTWQHKFGDKHALLAAELVPNNTVSIILAKVVEHANRYPHEFEEVRADIGGGGNYLNPKLRDDERLPVVDVNFAEVKESGVAAWNIVTEAGLLEIPAEFKEFIDQVRDWKRVNGRIAKGNDHLCDTGVCYFSRLVDELGVRHIRIMPRSFSSGPNVHDSRPPVDRSTANYGKRVPIARAFGRGGRRGTSPSVRARRTR